MNFATHTFLAAPTHVCDILCVQQTDEPVEENTVDLPEDHDGVKVRKAGSKRPAFKKVQQEGKKRV